MQNLKYDTNELIYKRETDSQTQKTNLWLPKRDFQSIRKKGSWGSKCCQVVKGTEN